VQPRLALVQVVAPQPVLMQRVPVSVPVQV